MDNGEATTNVDQTYNIRISNIYGILVYEAKSTGAKFNVPVNNLKEGNYIIEVSDGYKSCKKPLVIKHK